MRIRIAPFAALLLVASAPSIAQPAGELAALRSDLRALQDREAIGALMIAYGRTLDARDYAGFAALFTDEAEYVSGPGAPSRGGKGIAAWLKGMMDGNPMGFAAPNFHVFFNQVIQVAGDTATATSNSFFVVPDAANRPQPVLMASYDDRFVRTAAGWRFSRRVVKGDIPAPRRAGGG